MRYAVISRGLTLEEIRQQCQACGASEIRVMPAARQVFCELDGVALSRLSSVPGLAVKPLAKVKAQQVTAPAAPAVVATERGYRLNSFFDPLRQALAPPLTGEGLTVAILDSGIRRSHQALAAKVVYEANLSASETADDVFDHGTGNAYIIACEVSPGARVMNIKVLDDTGWGDTEAVVAGIDEVCCLVSAARDQGLAPTAPEYPNVVNMSFGSPDDGDPENPIRVAVRTAAEEYGLDMVAAAGNEGPRLSTVMIPACDPLVVAVGGVRSDAFTIWERSSRGPTLEGEIKPDFVFWGTDIYMASATGDDAYAVKSGTSFSAPVASAILGLLWEAGRRVFGPDWRIGWGDIEQVAPFFCLKPEEAPLRKDNTYGYGLLALGPMVGQLVRPAAPMAQVAEMITPVLSLGMMGMLMTGMVRAVRKQGGP
jgi:serine protease AprX